MRLKQRSPEDDLNAATVDPDPGALGGGCEAILLVSVFQVGRHLSRRCAGTRRDVAALDAVAVALAHQRVLAPGALCLVSDGLADEVFGLCCCGPTGRGKRGIRQGRLDDGYG
jgi:hypothetical protein